MTDHAWSRRHGVLEGSGVEHEEAHASEPVDTGDALVGRTDAASRDARAGEAQPPTVADAVLRRDPASPQPPPVNRWGGQGVPVGTVHPPLLAGRPPVGVQALHDPNVAKLNRPEPVVTTQAERDPSGAGSPVGRLVADGTADSEAFAAGPLPQEISDADADAASGLRRAPGDPAGLGLAEAGGWRHAVFHNDPIPLVPELLPQVKELNPEPPRAPQNDPNGRLPEDMPDFVAPRVVLPELADLGPDELTTKNLLQSVFLGGVAYLGALLAAALVALSWMLGDAELVGGPQVTAATLIPLSFQVAGMGLMHLLHPLGLSGGLALFPLLVPLGAALAMRTTGRRVMRASVPRTLQRRLAMAAVVVATVLALQLLFGLLFALRDTGSPIVALSAGGVAGTSLLVGLPAYVYVDRKRTKVLHGQLGAAARTLRDHLVPLGLFAGLVLSVGLVAVSGASPLLLPTLWPTLSGMGFSLINLGAVTDLDGLGTLTLFDLLPGALGVVLLAVAVLGAIVTAMRWWARGGAAPGRPAWVLPVLYALAGLALMFVCRWGLVFSGIQGNGLRLVAWTFVTMGVLGTLIQWCAGTVAPTLVPLLPRAARRFVFLGMTPPSAPKARTEVVAADASGDADSVDATVANDEATAADAGAAQDVPDGTTRRRFAPRSLLRRRDDEDAEGSDAAASAAHGGEEDDDSASRDTDPTGPASFTTSASGEGTTMPPQWVRRPRRPRVWGEDGPGAGPERPSWTPSAPGGGGAARRQEPVTVAQPGVAEPGEPATVEEPLAADAQQRWAPADAPADAAGVTQPPRSTPFSGGDAATGPVPTDAAAGPATGPVQTVAPQRVAGALAVASSPRGPGRRASDATVDAEGSSANLSPGSGARRRGRRRAGGNADATAAPLPDQPSSSG